MEESAAERRGPAADPVGPGSELVPAAPPTPTVLPPVSGSETPGAAGDEVAGGAGDSRLDQLLDRVMSVHRPAVLAHLRGIRSRYPDATPEQVLRILERRYLTTVTT
ncbi:hypothetical protein FJ656_34720, partial [Schumannella luteola]